MSIVLYCFSVIFRRNSGRCISERENHWAFYSFFIAPTFHFSCYGISIDVMKCFLLQQFFLRELLLLNQKRSNIKNLSTTYVTKLETMKLIHWRCVLDAVRRRIKFLHNFALHFIFFFRKRYYIELDPQGKR